MNKLINDVLLYQAIIKTPEIIEGTKFPTVCHRHILNISATNQAIFPNSSLAFSDYLGQPAYQ